MPGGTQFPALLSNSGNVRGCGKSLSFLQDIAFPIYLREAQSLLAGTQSWESWLALPGIRKSPWDTERTGLKDQRTGAPLACEKNDNGEGYQLHGLSLGQSLQLQQQPLSHRVNLLYKVCGCHVACVL